MHYRFPLLSLLVSMCWALLGPLPSAVLARQVSPQDARIKSAIDKANKYLLARLATEQNGQAAIGVVALVKSGIKPDTPAIKAVCDRLCSQIDSNRFSPQQHFVYEAGVCLLALANVDSKKYKPQIEVLAQFIIANQGAQGQWHYRDSQQGDTSISQYAMLGLWEASRAGVVVPMDVWDRAANWHTRTQNQDGGFSYQPVNQSYMGGALHSMTAAGIGSLRIARRHLFPAARDRIVVEVVTAPTAKKNRSGKRFGMLEPVFRDDDTGVSNGDGVAQKNANFVAKVSQSTIDAAVDKGVAWMTKNFTVEKPTGYPIYFLYGLERAAALAEVKQFGTHDWYAEGADHLVSIQNPDGSWSDPSGSVPATAFGVLFLTKATSKMVGPTVPRVEFGSGVLVGGRGLPDQLGTAQLDDGKVKKAQIKTPLEDLLGQLENPQLQLPENTQAEIVERVVIGDRKALIGQIDRLKKLARHKEPEIRRTALWALGRSDDLRLAPILVEGLKDSDVDVYVEARNALRCLSRQVEDFSAKDEPIDAATREREYVKWKDWYKTIRAYDERDDLVAPGE